MDKRSAKNDNNDLRSFFFKFWKHWLVYTISIILALSIAVLYSKFKIPIFEAGSQLIVHENESSMNPGRFIEGYELFANRNDFDNELITLQSSLHVYNTIVKMNLSVSYYEYKINGSREIYKTAPFIVIFDKEIPQAVDVKFYIDIVDKKSFRISSKAKEASIYSFIDQKVLYKKENFSYSEKFNFGEEIRGTFFNFKVFLNEEHNIDEIINNKYYFILNSFHSLTHKYQNSLIIEPVNIESTVVNINHRSSNIEKSLDFLSNLNETYINSNLNKKNHIADNTIQFIDNQLNEIQDSLYISENILQDYRASHQVIDIGEKSSRIYDQLRELEQQKAELDVNSKYYSYIQDYFSKSEDISDLVVPSSLGINDQLLNNLIQELITLNAERVSLISNNQQRNPYLKNLDIKIKNLKNTIVENIKYIQNTTEIAFNDVNKRISMLNTEINKLPKTQRQLIGYERNFRINDAIYTYLLEKRSEAEIARVSNLPDYEIIEPPKYLSTVSPKTQRNYIFALLAGLFIPFLFIEVFNLMVDKIKSSEDIDDITNFPVVGNILHAKTSTKNIFIENTNSPTAESFRNLRTNLIYYSQDDNKQVILITSTIGGEGKSFCAINLAYSMAYANKRTILLEFDLRIPKLSEQLKSSNELGISSFLSNQANIDDIINKSEISELDFILAGSIPPNPSELISSEKAIELINALKESYDIIILDTPPVGIISDAKLLMDVADVKLYTVRQNYTPRNAFRTNIIDLSSKIKSIGIIFNDIKIQKGTGVYSYGYKYYSSKSKKKKINITNNILIKSKSKHS